VSGAILQPPDQTIGGHLEKVYSFFIRVWYVRFSRDFIKIRKVHLMKKLTKGDQTLDPIDRALIVALHQNARASIRALGRQVGLSAPGCSERLKRLEGSGVISGFSVELDAQALGFALQALVRVKPLTGKFQQVEQLLAQMAECVVCYKITGDDSFVCHLYIDSVAHLDLTLQKIAPLADTNTSIIKTVEKKLPAL
jgi:Lrp/AsnC family leucine-responsive transcriptional regulator